MFRDKVIVRDKEMQTNLFETANNTYAADTYSNAEIEPLVNLAKGLVERCVEKTQTSEEPKRIPEAPYDTSPMTTSPSPCPLWSSSASAAFLIIAIFPLITFTASGNSLSGA